MAMWMKSKKCCFHLFMGGGGGGTSMLRRRKKTEREVTLGVFEHQDTTEQRVNTDSEHPLCLRSDPKGSN